MGYIERGVVDVELEELLPVTLKNVSCPEIVQDINRDQETAVSTSSLDFLDSFLRPENAKLLEAVSSIYY